MLILSTEEHPVVGARARKLQVPCVQGVADKRAALVAELDRRGGRGGQRRLSRERRQ